MLNALLPALVAITAILAPANLHAESAIERIATDGKVTAAAVPDQLPLSAYDEKGQLTGFDIDVSREIARHLGQPVTFVVPGWEAILSGAWDDRFQFCACSITPTKERAQRLAFPATYRFDAAVVVVRADDTTTKSAAGVSDRRIGVKRDTTFQQYLEHSLVIFSGDPITYQIDKPKIVTFPDKGDAIKALVDGKVDAAVTSLVTARGVIADGAKVRIVPGFLFFEPVAVAIAKGDDALKERIADAVGAMQADGSLTKLSLKWFGIDLTRILE